MKVYGLFYNPCVHESADGLVSLHMARYQAEKALERFKQERYDAWRENNDYFKRREEVLGVDEDGSMVEEEYSVPDWQVLSVQELEVEDE